MLRDIIPSGQCRQIGFLKVLPSCIQRHRLMLVPARQPFHGVLVNMCMAVVCRDSGDLAELRGRIIQIFFKHLTSSNDVAVSMSQEGLAAVIAHQKMPKHLLQVHTSCRVLNLFAFCASDC